MSKFKYNDRLFCTNKGSVLYHKNFEYLAYPTFLEYKGENYWFEYKYEDIDYTIKTSTCHSSIAGKSDMYINLDEEI